MTAKKLTIATLVVVLGGLGTSGQSPEGATPEPSKNALTAKTWPELHKLLLPQKGEYPWEQVTWYASLWHARKKAAAEDKPILVWVTGGAGFNDPLGNC
jgi:hypothetical protein